MSQIADNIGDPKPEVNQKPDKVEGILHVGKTRNPNL